MSVSGTVQKICIFHENISVKLYEYRWWEPMSEFLGYIETKWARCYEKQANFEKYYIFSTENRKWKYTLILQFSKIEIRNTTIWIIWMLILKKWFDRIWLNFRILELLARSERFMNFKKIVRLSFVKYLFNIF